MAEKKAARDERYTWGLISRWPNLATFETPVFMGMFSWTMPAKSWRLLYEPNIVDIGFGPQTPTEVTRDYLDVKYPERLRATGAQAEEIRKHRSFPCMSQRWMGDGVYVDLKSAYWSVLAAVGWDVDYYPGRFCGVRSSVLDFPLPDNKVARSSLVTAGLSSPIRYWTGSKLSWKNSPNRHINYGLWALVMDVLHGVAHEMVTKVGAVYVHTDGYIVQSGFELDALEIIESWGLQGGIKYRGPTEVYGVGVYRVGTKQTSRAKAAPILAHYNVNPPDIRWLKPTFRTHAERVRNGS